MLCYLIKINFGRNIFLFVDFIYDKVCDLVYICIVYKCNNGELKLEDINSFIFNF